MIDDLPGMWNYGKLSAKYLACSIKVIDTGIFVVFFVKVLLEQLLKFLLDSIPIKSLDLK